MNFNSQFLIGQLFLIIGGLNYLVSDNLIWDSVALICIIVGVLEIWGTIINNFDDKD